MNTETSTIIEEIRALLTGEKREPFIPEPPMFLTATQAIVNEIRSITIGGGSFSERSDLTLAKEDVTNVMQVNLSGNAAFEFKFSQDEVAGKESVFVLNNVSESEVTVLIPNEPNIDTPANTGGGDLQPIVLKPGASTEVSVIFTKTQRRWKSLI